jgi:hypothetical protein
VSSLLPFFLPSTITTMSTSLAACYAYALHHLEDPTKPFPCAILLLAHLDPINTVLHLPSEGAVQAMDKRFSNVLSVIARWLTAPRTSAEVNNLMGSSCRCSDSSYQQTIQAHEDGLRLIERLEHRWPLESLLHTLLKISLASISFFGDAPQQRGRRRLDRLFSNRIVWPFTLEQLLPWGREDSIRGLLCWCKVQDPYSDMDMSTLLEGVHNYAYAVLSPLALPYVVTSRVFIPQALLPTMERALDVLSYSIEAPVSPIAHDTAIMTLCRGSRIIWDICNIACDGPQRREMIEHALTRMLTCVTHAYAQLLDVLERFSGHTLRRAIIEATNSLLVFGTFALHDFASRPDLQDFPIPLRFAKDSLAIQDTIFTPWQNLWAAMKQLEKAQDCASPNCSRTYADVWPFHYCGGCRRVSYCSRACQKIAWSHAAVPHRLICEVIRITCSKNEIPRRIGSKDVEHATADPSVFEPEAAEAIVKHFEDLTRHRLQTSRTCPCSDSRKSARN